MVELVKYKTVELEKWRVGLTHAVSKHLQDVDVVIFDDKFIDAIEVNVRGFIWAESLQHVEIKYPATWQDAWKEEHLQNMSPGNPDFNKWWPSLKDWLIWRKWLISRWALRCWPIQYKTHIVNVKAVFPELRLAMPEQPYNIHYTESVEGPDS